MPLDVSRLNPTKRYARRYEPGHFLHLAKRYYRRTRRTDRAAKVVFGLIFANKKVQGLFKSISGHGLWPIGIATAITITGHSAMFIRGVALIICALWLSIDVGIGVAEKDWRFYWKSAAFAACCGLSLSVAMGIMYWFLSSTLDDQQQNVYEHLLGAVELPPSGFPWQSFFSITNGGNFDIRHYEIFCHYNMTVMNYGSSFVRNTDAERKLSDDPLRGGGDTASEQCLSIVAPASKDFDCADVTVHFDYSLEKQPIIDKRKSFRFFGYQESGKFIWVSEPVSSSTNYCGTRGY